MESKKGIIEEIEPTFIILYNAGDGEMHEVILPPDQEKAIGLLLMRMNNDNIQVNENIACKITIKKYKVARNEIDEK